MKLGTGRLHRCRSCRGVWLERDAAVALFEGRTCTFEAPAPDGSVCGGCRNPMAWLRFTDAGPLFVCGLHGIWLDARDRALLPRMVEKKLKRREFFDGLTALFDAPISDGGGSSDSCEVGGGGSPGGDASCGCCGSCGGGGD